MSLACAYAHLLRIDGRGGMVDSGSVRKEEEREEKRKRRPTTKKEERDHVMESS